MAADSAAREVNEGEGGHVLAYVDAVSDVKEPLFSLRSAVGGDGGGESPRQAAEILNPILKRDVCLVQLEIVCCLLIFCAFSLNVKNFNIEQIPEIQDIL